MKTYQVNMPARTNFIAFVKANSPEEALAKADNEFVEFTVSLCHQCSNTIDEPVVSDGAELSDVFEVADDNEDAERFFEEWGGDEDEEDEDVV